MIICGYALSWVNSSLGARQYPGPVITFLFGEGSLPLEFFMYGYGFRNCHLQENNIHGARIFVEQS